MNSSTLRMTLSMSLALLLIFQPCVLPSAFAAPPPAPVNTGAPPVAEGVAAKSKAADAGEAAEFISVERLCCPFLGFALVVEAEGGSAWLRLTGREGVKAFIREEVSGLLGGAIDRGVLSEHAGALRHLLRVNLIGGDGGGYLMRLTPPQVGAGTIGPPRAARRLHNLSAAPSVD